jgi:hypothetical protein
MYGTLYLVILAHPTAGPAPLMSVCVADYSFVGISITERIKKWQRLTPGHALIFQRDVASEIAAVLRGPLQPGEYEFRASYEPPSIPADDRRLLTAERIAYPTTRLKVPPLRLTVGASR